MKMILFIALAMLFRGAALSEDAGSIFHSIPSSEVMSIQGDDEYLGVVNLCDSGLYDMIGNVNEWVADFYEGKNYSGDLVSPVDSSGRESIFRGGAFNCELKYCRISNRNHVKSDVRNYAIGFRLAE